jgi:2-oxoglutarate ferredoxin oxidoreductase subunit alpha
MQPVKSVNDLVIRFANVNGSGSASANTMFGKAVFRMGIPISPRNIFPSNIQGLPTWFEVRVNERGYRGRRGGYDIMVAMNPQTWMQDIAGLMPGGYLVYDSTMERRINRDDIQVVGIPCTRLCLEAFGDHRSRQLFKNMVYVGALAALIAIDFDVLEKLVAEQFPGKEKLIKPNIDALTLGFDYAKAHFDCPLPVRIRRSQAAGDSILISGNEAAALGAVYGGATVCAWYPITPSTSLADAFASYCEKLRVDDTSGKNKFAIVQAEDELAAIGMAIGAGWNGARAFTATSGPGISLMSEFLGLGYFAEVPVVIFDIQRGGPSTGMPTRTQQSDLLLSAYASHGDTRHILLFPQDPHECFEFGAQAFDVAERLQTPVFVMSDLDVGMNEWTCAPLKWDGARRYDRGKVLDAKALDEVVEFGRYLDVDGDGICYRTYPGTHPEKGAFFTRGTSRDRFARYTEEGVHYVDNMERLTRKFDTARNVILPKPEIVPAGRPVRDGVIVFGTSTDAMREARDHLNEEGIYLDILRLRAYPFADEVFAFVNAHERIFVVEQNRDGQLRMLLLAEGKVNPDKLISVVHYDGVSITATQIADQIRKHSPSARLVRSGGKPAE